MSKIAIPICLSFSIMAIVLAGYSGIQAQKEAPVEEGKAELVGKLSQLQETLTALDGRIAKLESSAEQVVSQGKTKSKFVSPRLKRALRKKAENSTGDPSVEEALELTTDQVAKIQKRLSVLEDEEHIAHRAREGRRIIREKEADKYRVVVSDTNRPIPERLRAFSELRERRSMDDGSLVTMLDMVTDTSIDLNMRREIVGHFEGVRSEALKEPMMHVVTQEQDPKMRAMALEALMYHGGDGEVMQLFENVSQQDANPRIQNYARRLLPKAEWFAARAEEGDEREGAAYYDDDDDDDK